MGKVVSQEDLILRRREAKSSHERFVLASGAFDLLHPGHIRFLEQARSFGDILVVAVYSDATVRDCASAAVPTDCTAKVPRPITPVAERAEILSALAAVDYVTECDGDSFPLLVAKLSPDVIAEGSDKPQSQSTSLPPPEHNLPSATTRVISILLDPGFSTTGLIDRIVKTGSAGNLGLMGRLRHPSA